MNSSTRTQAPPTDTRPSDLTTEPNDVSWLDSLLRKPLLATLRKFQLGRLEMELPDGTTEVFGDKDENGPRAQIAIRNDEFFRKCALYGNVGLGEAYVDGDWETSNIRAVIEWFIVNLHADESAKGSSQRCRLVGLLRLLDRMRHRLRPNNKTMSRRNIEEHYDLGNDFYKLWLDPSMTYSSARFTCAEQSLESAQSEKYDALCQKLQLTPNDRVLEIGCGWGGFALHAARNYDCHITGLTISPAQHQEAISRIKRAGLEDRIEIRMQDYRDLTGQFDKIVSIEMLEAVGDKFLETWCAKCHDILAPEGLLAVQMITVPDCDHAELKRGADWIQKHIFPGSLLLSIGRMNEAMNRTGNLFLHGLEDIGSSYNRTLSEWHTNFNENLDEVRALGFSERFVRKWNYYLQYSQAAFASRNISVVQGVYTRPANAATLTHEGGLNS
jgi:cyclopropane-fatty-acyl-phospholipid synthase